MLLVLGLFSKKHSRRKPYSRARPICKNIFELGLQFRFGQVNGLSVFAETAGRL